MAVTDQQILDNAKESLNRILAADTAEWFEGGHRQRLLEIDRLERLIAVYERKVAAGGTRRVLNPIKSIAD